MNTFDSVRNSEPGTSALTPLPLPGQPIQTAWLLRKTSAEIQALKSNADLRFMQKGGMYRATVNGKLVDVLVLMIAIGQAPFEASSIHLGIGGNELQDGVYGGILENLTTQNVIPIVFIGDSKNVEFVTSTENVARHFAKKALAGLSKVPPWSDADWQQAVLDLQRNNPDLRALWQKLA